MYFGDGVKNKTREMRARGDHEGVKKELLRVKLGEYEKLKFQEKVDVDYYLAWYASMDNNKDLLNKYLKELENLFNNQDKNDYKVEYYRYLWLKINSNYKKMNKEDVVASMMEIHHFYECLGDHNMALAATASIHGIYGEGDKVLESIKNVVNSKFHVEKEVLNSFLDGLEDLDQELYIEGRRIIEEYATQSVVI